MNEKESFRQSKKWQNFRKKMFTESSRDFVTHKKLRSGYRLHHLDLNPDHYEDVSDPSHFENLNSDIHSVVHKLYTYYKKDPLIIDRLRELLERMKEINSYETLTKSFEP